MTRFRAVAGGVRVTMSAAEAAVLSKLPDLLATAGDPDEDPAAARLTPNAYRDDPARAAEFSRLTGSDLDDLRLADRSRFVASLEPGMVRLALDDAEAWLRVIGEARLLLAARAGIEEDGWLYDEYGDDPRMALLYYLSGVQDALIGALMGQASLLEGP